MIGITKKEAEYIRENGMGKFVKISSYTHKSTSRHYWLVENEKVLNELAKYRKKILVEHYE